MAATDRANSDVERIEKHRVDNAAGKIKNAHLKALSTLAFGFSVPCVGAYLALRLAAAGAFLLVAGLAAGAATACCAPTRPSLVGVRTRTKVSRRRRKNRRAEKVLLILKLVYD